MKQIQLNSPEFNRVMKNLQLENLHLSDTLQKKALEIVNSGMVVTPDLIKKALANGEIQ
ncbi:Zn-dependent hydrolase [Sporosarcina sp. ACRSM]|uniref:Zn-dependent hydrolase n=1 Tax=Sporosarcina sp. ACRSM TaxID=2918216 RepID=UPI001EF421EF|nr:Zn-dependent hydrolase [Sporosarcina sp. ACRSM]MCG7334431.1 Zn-dependent hydrolase [Sporosarcina sp. ACRSM]